ncbi:hypothetical protein BC830DRAFT_1090637 [Chytriomyces sp. MP71]|nr:hypothetical protein BC830DRAFT_1090637 [Chytriomyces sp. MP71]
MCDLKGFGVNGTPTVQKAKDLNDILRDNSLTTLLLTHYIRKKGDNFLKKIVPEKLESMFPLLCECEMDPTKLNHISGNLLLAQELARNEENLTKVCNGIMDTFFQNVDQIPDSVRRVCKFLKEAIERPELLEASLKAPPSAPTARPTQCGHPQSLGLSTPRKGSTANSTANSIHILTEASVSRDKLWYRSSFGVSSSSLETTESNSGALNHKPPQRTRSSSRNHMQFEPPSYRSQQGLYTHSSSSSIRTASTSASNSANLISKDHISAGASGAIESSAGGLLSVGDSAFLSISSSRTNSTKSDGSKVAAQQEHHVAAKIQRRFWQVFGSPQSFHSKRSSVGRDDAKSRAASAPSLEMLKQSASEAAQARRPPEVADNSAASLGTSHNLSELAKLRARSPTASDDSDDDRYGSGPKTSQSTLKMAVNRSANAVAASATTYPFTTLADSKLHGLQININIISATPLDAAFLQSCEQEPDLVPRGQESEGVQQQSEELKTVLPTTKTTKSLTSSRQSSLKRINSSRKMSLASQANHEDSEDKLCLHEKVLGSLLFLRFLVPSIITPEIIPPTPAHRRGLILAGKVLTASSNGVEFGTKEDYMMPLNFLLKSNRTRIKEFVDSLVESKIRHPSSSSSDDDQVGSPRLNSNLSSSTFSIRDPSLFSLHSDTSTNNSKSKSPTKAYFLPKAATLSMTTGTETNRHSTSTTFVARKPSNAHLLAETSTSGTPAIKNWARRKSSPCLIPSAQEAKDTETIKRSSLPSTKIFQTFNKSRKSVAGELSAGTPASLPVPGIPVTVAAAATTRQQLHSTWPDIERLLACLAGELGPMEAEVMAACAHQASGAANEVATWLQEDASFLMASFSGLKKWCSQRYGGEDSRQRKSGEAHHGSFMKMIGSWIAGGGHVAGSKESVTTVIG